MSLLQYFKSEPGAAKAAAAPEPAKATLSGSKRSRSTMESASDGGKAIGGSSSAEEAALADAAPATSAPSSAAGGPGIEKGGGASAGAGAAPAAVGAGAGAAIESGGASAGALPPAQTALLAKYGAGGVHDSWKPFLATEMAKPYFAKLHAFVTAARARSTVFPPPDRVFSAFSLTPFESIKVVILGQDPYHGAGQAEGLSFSVPRGVAIPPSLRNILAELATDVGTKKPSHGHLAHWATQGVFLLNAVLTVESGKANSHAAAGWETFTTEVIREISRRRSGVVFMLWGKPAQVKGASVDRSKHLVLEAPHPSPLSAHRGFLGCKHFSQANAYLVKNGGAPIDWSLNA